MKKIGNLENILNLLHWDNTYNMKPDSEQSRSKEIIDLSGMIRQLLLNNEIKKLITLTEKEEKELDHPW